jgi:hypothetical protein
MYYWSKYDHASNEYSKKVKPKKLEQKKQRDTKLGIRNTKETN